MASCTGHERLEASGPISAVRNPAELFKQPYKRGTATDPYGYVTPQIAAAERLTDLEQASILAEKYNVGLRVNPVATASRPYKRGTATDPLGYLNPKVIAENRLTPGEVTSIHAAQFKAEHPKEHALFTAYLVQRHHEQTQSGLSKAVKSAGSALKSAGSTVVKVATAPERAISGTVIDIAKGKNVVQSLKNRGADLAKSTIQGAKILGNVATLIPGLGTAAAFAIQYTSSVADAVAHGRNVVGSLEHAAIDAALNSLPGGELTGAAIKTVANIAKAGIDGKNVLKSAANEVAGAAISLVPSAEAQTILKGAADAALSGQNVLQGAKASAINAALASIPNDQARAALKATLQGKSPESIVQNAGSQLLSAAAAAAPTGGAAAVVTGITGKSPNQIIQAGNNMANNAYKLTSVPTMVPRPGTARPVLQAARAPQRTLEPRTSLPRPMRGNARVTHRPLSNRAKMFVRNKGGAVARDVSGLTQDGKWLVQAGDTGQKIAKAVTGDSTRWRELIAVNPKNMTNAADVKATGFPVYTYKYNPINLPASWVKPATVTQPAPSPAAAPPAVSVPSIIPTVAQAPSQTILTQIQTVLAPAGDVAAQGQARAILASWGKTDGANQAGLTDYGGMSEIGATSWSARDVLMAASFGRWFDSNIGASHAQSPIGSSGQWSQSLSDALHYWAENKAAQVLPGISGGQQPTTVATPPNAQTPSASPSMSLPQLPDATVQTQTPAVSVTPGQTTVQTPSGGGTINLPGMTITPGSATASTAPVSTQSQQPTQKPGFIAQNKASLITAGIGGLVAYASKFV